MGEIKHGLLAEVYGPWIEWEGTEWGEQMRPLHQAYSCGEDYALSDDQLDQIEAMLHENLMLAYPDFMEYQPSEIERIKPEANEIYTDALASWKARAEEMGKYNEGRAQREYDEALERIPDWMKS